MAEINEIQSLEQISYKSRIKVPLIVVVSIILFAMAFLNHYPLGTQIKTLMKKNLQGRCTPEFQDIRIEFFMPKVIVSDLSLPAVCFGRSGDPLKLSFVTVNFNLINFAPFGIPFKIETEMNGQPLTVYFVQGISQRVVRLKDQAIVLARLEPLFGKKFQLSGTMTVDLHALLKNDNSLEGMSFKVQSKDLEIPPQSIEGFTTPQMKVNDLYLEANSENSSRITVDKMIVGDTESPMRANFKGRIDLQEGNIAFSPMDLSGEISFSENFKETVPLVDLLFQNYTQKDGFYQIRLGGTLGQPRLLNK